MRRRLLVALVAVPLLAGCSSRFAEADRDSRAAALAVHKQVLRLKQAARLKAEAEERYYGESVKALDEARRMEAVADRAKRLVEQARAGAAEVRKRPEMSPRELAALLERATGDWMSLVDAGEAARRAQREAVKQNLQALRDLGQEYAALEQSLIQLSTTPGQRDQLKALMRFIEQAAGHYRRLEEARQKAQAGSEKKGTTP